MKNLISAEALKLRTLWLPRLVLVLAALGAGFIMFAVVRIAQDEHTTVTASDLATAPAQPLWFLAVIVAVLAAAGEFQHRTIRTTLLQEPRRRKLVADSSSSLKPCASTRPASTTPSSSRLGNDRSRE